MRRVGARLAVVLVVVLAQLLTDVALAAGAERKSVAVQFSLPEDSGFEIEFTAGGQGRRSFGSFSTRSETRTQGSGATYISSRGGRFSGRRVEMRLRPVGMVSVRFEERSSKQIRVPGCEGRAIIRRGVFVGRFSFRGEGGYAVSAGRRTKGTMTVDRVRDCTGIPVRKHRPRPVVLTSCQPKSDAIYFASDGDGPASHTASVFDELGSLFVIRGAFAVSEEDEIVVASDLSTATVTPPPPFTGTGQYESRRLDGDLAVSLPGLAQPVPLTPGKAKLERGRGIGIGISCGSVVGIGSRGSPRLSGRPSTTAGLPPPAVAAARRMLAAGASR